MDIALDDMTPNTGVCPALNELYLQLQNSSQWKVHISRTKEPQFDSNKAHEAKYAPLVQQLQKIFNSTDIPPFHGTKLTHHFSHIHRAVGCTQG